jgi:diphthine-ammonia ligase
MYQTVGHMGIEKFAEAMELPLYRKTTSGVTSQKGKNYEPLDETDEVEDLYKLLKEVKVVN